MATDLYFGVANWHSSLGSGLGATCRAWGLGKRLGGTTVSTVAPGSMVSRPGVGRDPWVLPYSSGGVHITAQQTYPCPLRDVLVSEVLRDELGCSERLYSRLAPGVTPWHYRPSSPPPGPAGDPGPYGTRWITVPHSGHTPDTLPVRS